MHKTEVRHYRRDHEFLIMAVNEQNLQSVKDLLQGDHIDIDGQDERGGFTALMRACLLGNKDIVKALLKKHPTIDIQNNLKRTALMVSLSTDFFNFTQQLLTNSHHNPSSSCFTL